MPSRLHIQINRRAIGGALLIWLAVQVSLQLKSVGVALLTPSSLLVSGLVAYPLLVIWPLLKGVAARQVRGEPQQSPVERRASTLVSVQIVALSSMLVGVLFYL